MSPLDAFKVFCVYVMCGPLEPCRSTRGDQPLLPHSHCSQLCQGVPEMPAPSWTQKGAGVTLQRWSCPVLWDWYHWRWDGASPGLCFHIPFPYPHTTAWDLSPSWERAGDSLLHTLYLLYHIIWTEQVDAWFYCSASFQAGPFPPGGISLSLYKNPNNKPQSFQKASKTPPWLLCFPHRAPVKLFSREWKPPEELLLQERGEHSIKS